MAEARRPQGRKRSDAPLADRAPVLTLPEAEAKAVVTAYTAAGVILEYGSGGSTALAAEMDDTTIFSVESDNAWLQGLADYFVENPPRARVVLHHADVGPTGPWGVPTDPAASDRFWRYPLEVWDRTDFLHPDLVLVDGRFRAACFLATLYRISRPVTLLWDDYADRPAYHEVERLVRPAAFHGRMAEFHLEPAMIATADLAWIIQQFTRKH